MERMSIEAEERKVGGKSVTRKLRRAGLIPAIIYGKDITPLAVQISAKEWVKLSRHLKRNSILDLFLGAKGGDQAKAVMVKGVQRAFPSDELLHIDFLHVSMERTIEVEIPVRLIGEAKGIKVGGIVEQHLRTVKADCLPTQIPEAIDVDVSELGIGDSFHVSDISLPGVRLLEVAEVAIVTVLQPVGDEKPAAVAEEGAEKKAE
jgi:large subunit ribosomal protein L25